LGSYLRYTVLNFISYQHISTKVCYKIEILNLRYWVWP